MIAVFLIEIVLLTVIYLKSKEAYSVIVKDLDKKLYPLRDLFVIPMFLIDKLGYRYNTGYDSRLTIKLATLYGQKNVRHTLKLHWASKLTYALVAMLALTFLAALSSDADISYLVFSVTVIGLVIYLSDWELDNKIKKRQLLLQYDFPYFINKLVLLVNAGMTVQRAWEKIACECTKNSPLYEEIICTYKEIGNGRSEAEAYEAFAKRCKLREITKFSSLIIQNLKKGNNELAAMLRLMSNECWDSRKSAAKRLGEEASTKLMLPLALMLIGIMMIVMLPAILQFGGL